MSEFRLGLPTDIPWKRVCVSSDMLDPIPCDSERPDRWKSSLAIFRYDPAEDYQPYDDRLVSYLKVVVTVAPYAPELPIDLSGKLVPPVLVEELEEAFPCYGALLQVTVSPSERDRDRWDKTDYPYFIDFEPKKRELYEAVTDTGEVLSGSSTSLSIGKSAQQTDSTENYNIDTGWNFGMNGSYAGTGGGFNVGESGQVGTIDRSGLQTTNLRTTEESTERRERQSHTTQLSQMYNLFQAFHLGTNRALFFMEPRPHIRQSEATFINGPRALEGMQEIFLVVSRPREMEDFCPAALLETAHLTKTPVYEYETMTHVIRFRLFAQAQNKDTTSGETDWTQPVAKTEDYPIPAGWEVDTSRGSGGYSIRILREARRRRGPTVTISSTTVSVYGEVTWRFWETGLFNDDHYANGYLDADVTVYLRKKEPDLKEMTEQLFLSARDLCCCEPRLARPFPWISWIGRIPGVLIFNGYADRVRLKESRQLASKIREGMISSIGSSSRYPRGRLSYEKSDLVVRRAAALLKSRRALKSFDEPVEASRSFSEGARGRVHAKLGSISVGELLNMRSAVLAKTLDVDEERVVAWKAEAVSEMSRPFRERSRPQPARSEPIDDLDSDRGAYVAPADDDDGPDWGAPASTTDRVRRVLEELFEAGEISQRTARSIVRRLEDSSDD